MIFHGMYSLLILQKYVFELVVRIENILYIVCQKQHYLQIFLQFLALGLQLLIYPAQYLIHQCFREGKRLYLLDKLQIFYIYSINWDCVLSVQPMSNSFVCIKRHIAILLDASVRAQEVLQLTA